MNIDRASIALELIARRHNISLECVTDEIQEAIRIAKQSNDPAIRAYWESIPCSGERLSAAELVAYLGEKLNGID